jgi:integrase
MTCHNRMMGRPPLPVGTWGSISVRTVGPRNVRARARFRDFDGSVRYVVRHGTSRTSAETALKLALSKRSDDTFGGELTSSTKMSVAAELWLAEVDQSARSSATKELYRYVVDGYIEGGLGSLQLRELTVPRVDKFLKAIVATHGPGGAKSCKSVLSGILGMAVRHGALPANPVREVAKIAQPRKAAPRALTPAEAVDLLARARAHAPSAHLDLADLIEFMLGTGVRLGEALAVRSEVVDLTAGTIEIKATVVRTKGAGVQIQDWPKTAAGWRVIAVPSQVVALLQRRRADPRLAQHVAFPSPLGHLRDVSNTTGDLRRLLDDLGYDWVSSHTFRKTVATRLDAAGLTARQIADHLGHASPSLTQDVYMGRQVATADAARSLETPP